MEKERYYITQASNHTNYTIGILLIPYIIIKQGRKIDSREAIDSQEYIMLFAFELALGH